MPAVSFQTHPDRYRHWQLRVEGALAWLVLAVDEDGGLEPGYVLKLNSYDLGVDIELADAVQRLRFEHPAVRAVVIASASPKVFCAGANIGMLARASHPTKVGFCKHTNETRCAIEDAGASAGQVYLAALGGSAAGGGYELALACERILLVDDGSAAVSLPEVALLGVLPGTGGLTRLTDKRGVRRDLADVFATRADGVKGATALRWGLVDELLPRGRFEAAVRERALEAAARSPQPQDARGVPLAPLQRREHAGGIEYSSLRVEFDRAGRSASLELAGPLRPPPADPLEEGCQYWPLRLARELDDAVLWLRSNELELGSWLLRARGDAALALAYGAQLAGPGWFAGEVRHCWKRVLKRLEVTSRTLIALIEPGSCFAGPLLEFALAADRSYMLDAAPEPGSGQAPAALWLGECNWGSFPMANGLSRLASRFRCAPEPLARLRERIGQPLDAAAALELGLVTATPDALDWDDELRLALEARANLSPDALSGLEANTRFAGPETLETKIFGRLSAWQNWIFQRPNAGGPAGALARYGSGQRPQFDPQRA